MTKKDSGFFREEQPLMNLTVSKIHSKNQKGHSMGTPDGQSRNIKNLASMQKEVKLNFKNSF